MKLIIAILFSMIISLPLRAENSRNAVTSPAARSVPQQSMPKAQVADELLPAAKVLKGETPEEKLANLSKKEQKLMKRLEKKLEKQQVKKSLKTKGTMSATFEDVITLAGAFVTVVGIISIIFQPLTGVIVALLGLLIYFLGTQAGGDLGSFF